MDKIFYRVGQWPIGRCIEFGVVVALLGALALMSGCATKEPAKVEAAPVSQHEAATMAVSNCALAIKEIAVSPAGDAASKVAAVGAVERLCAQGGAQFAVRQYQAPEPSLGATLWQAALQVADIGARWYGIKSNRDVAINASDNSRATSVASYGAFTNIASAGFAANGQIASYIQAPAPNITLSGTGVIGSGSYVGPVNRNCVGGNGAAGAGASGTATIPGVPGAPANGGAANC